MKLINSETKNNSDLEEIAVIVSWTLSSKEVPKLKETILHKVCMICI